MRAALDTNILAYAEGLGDECRCEKARSLISQIQIGKVLLPAQTLGELYQVLTTKQNLSAKEARETILTWGDSFEVMDSTWRSFQSAFDLVADHQLQIWDALILAVTAENRCRLLITEDFQDGFTWRGVTIVNPFTHADSPMLEALL